MGGPHRQKSRLRRAWEAWQQIDAFRGLVELVRSVGWIAFAFSSAGSAVAAIGVSLVLAALGWIAGWGPYLVAAVSVVFVPVANYLVWRRSRSPSPRQIASSESIILAKPANGDRLVSPLEVSGYANVMEGNVIIWHRLREGDEWQAIGNATAGMGEPGQLFHFQTTISLNPGEHYLRACADPGMYHERAGDEDCVETRFVVED